MIVFLIFRDDISFELNYLQFLLILIKIYLMDKIEDFKVDEVIYPLANCSANGCLLFCSFFTFLEKGDRDWFLIYLQKLLCF